MALFLHVCVCVCLCVLPTSIGKALKLTVCSDPLWFSLPQWNRTSWSSYSWSLGSGPPVTTVNSKGSSDYGGKAYTGRQFKVWKRGNVLTLVFSRNSLNALIAHHWTTMIDRQKINLLPVLPAFLKCANCVCCHVVMSPQSYLTLTWEWCGRCVHRWWPRSLDKPHSLGIGRRPGVTGHTEPPWSLN